MTLEEIKSQIKLLSNSDIVELRDWLDDVAENAEDQLEVTDEFKKKILEAESDFQEGRVSRIRRPTD